MSLIEPDVPLFEPYLVFIFTDAFKDIPVKINGMSYIASGRIPRSVSGFNNVTNWGKTMYKINLSESNVNNLEVTTNDPITIYFQKASDPRFLQPIMGGSPDRFQQSDYFKPHVGYGTARQALSGFFNEFTNLFMPLLNEPVIPRYVFSTRYRAVDTPDSEPSKTGESKIYVIAKSISKNTDGQIFSVGAMSMIEIDGRLRVMNTQRSNFFNGTIGAFEFNITKDKPFKFSFGGEYRNQPYAYPTRMVETYAEAIIEIYAGDLTGYTFDEFSNMYGETIQRIGGVNPFAGKSILSFTQTNRPPNYPKTIPDIFNDVTYTVYASDTNQTITTARYNSQVKLTTARTTSNVLNDIIALRAQILATNYPDQTRKAIDLAACDQLLESWHRNDITLAQLDEFYQKIKAGYLVTKEEIEAIQKAKDALIEKLNNEFITIYTGKNLKLDNAYWLIQQIESKIGVDKEAIKPISDDPLGGFELRTQDQLWRDQLDNLFDTILFDKNQLQTLIEQITIQGGIVLPDNITKWENYKTRFEDLIIKIPAVLDNSPALQIIAGLPVSAVAAIYIPGG